MSRSNKKGPYIDERLLKKVTRLNSTGQKVVLKTWSRDCQIAPEFVGHRFAVYNGRTFIEFFVTEDMVGYRLGEFAPTRVFRGHGQVTKRVLEKT